MMLFSVPGTGEEIKIYIASVQTVYSNNCSVFAVTVSPNSLHTGADCRSQYIELTFISPSWMTRSYCWRHDSSHSQL